MALTMQEKKCFVDENLFYPAVLLNKRHYFRSDPYNLECAFVCECVCVCVVSAY